MSHASDYYLNNPLIHRDRRLGTSASEWVRSFSCEDLKPLIVCRGPIRKEAMDVYQEMGITHYGILLSEKDSIVYPNALAPELRQLTDSNRVHRVPDYTGASKEERVERIHQIIRIAQDNGYDSIFAGYGFMAEDEEFVAAIEKAGVTFIGPCANTQARAGKKDEAKRTALSVNVSVTPGVNNVTALTLLKKHPTREKLLALVKADMYVASRYAEMCSSDEVRRACWSRISSEYDRTRQAVLDVLGAKDLLASAPWLERSIEARNPYVDPLNLIQIEFMRRRRAKPDLDPQEAEELRNLLRLSVQGVAAGMRTTG